jgi:hypothetical protein
MTMSTTSASSRATAHCRLLEAVMNQWTGLGNQLRVCRPLTQIRVYKCTKAEDGDSALISACLARQAVEPSMRRRSSKLSTSKSVDKRNTLQRPQATAPDHSKRRQSSVSLAVEQILRVPNRQFVARQRLADVKPLRLMATMKT